MALRCLITGGNGFLGKGLKRYLIDWEINTIGRANCDIRYNYGKSEEVVIPNFDLVVYAMGKAHDFNSNNNASSFDDMFYTNCVKLKNFLFQLSKSRTLPSTFIYISSVSVYGINSGINIDENHELQARDAYGKSKVEAEKIITKWAQRENINCVILRLPLVIGDNPPGNLNRMIKALERSSFVLLDHGKAKKSVVHIGNVAEVISKSIGKNGIFNITDGINPTFKEIVCFFAKATNSRIPISIPTRFAIFFLFFGGLFSRRLRKLEIIIEKMTLDLTFSNQKAVKELNWNPKPALSYNVSLEI